MLDLIETQDAKALEPSKAQQIKQVFEPMVAMLESMEAEYADVMTMEQTPEKSAAARDLRLRIKRVRVDAEKIRKTQKEQYLRAGNAIQGAYNILKDAVATKEENLAGIEEYYERIEQEKAKKLAETRAAELDQYEAEYQGLDLGTMELPVWENFLAGAKARYTERVEAEKAVQEARQKAEQDAHILRSREKAVAKYAHLGAFDRITAEMSEKEFSSLLDELQGEQDERDAAEEQLRTERETLAEQNRLQQEQLKKEREKREAEERKRKEAEAAERKRKADEAAAEKARASAPDKEKLFTLAKALIDTEFSTQEARSAAQAAYRVLTEAAGAM